MKYIIIQAGGQGTRLKHLTANKPKALVPIENLPMIFHLFNKFPDKKFIIIADYKKDVIRKYLSCFSNVKYLIVDANGSGTCSGIAKAAKLIPENESCMLIWSDLILPEDLSLPFEYQNDEIPDSNYIGISKTFHCRWSYCNNQFKEEKSAEHGVAGFFLFKDKNIISNIPENGELVRYMQEKNIIFDEISLAGTREFGLLEEYEKLAQEKCRPFNRIKIEDNILIKEAVNEQGRWLSQREKNWYDYAKSKKINIIPKIYSTDPLKMEYIKGMNIYECDFEYSRKKTILKTIIDNLKALHNSERVPADMFSLKKAYFNKTIERISKVEYLVPFARDAVIEINGKKCRNIFFHKEELERKIDQLECNDFCFIHGDCTFSNLIIDKNDNPFLIDPRGYFGYTEIFGDERYDWAKLYYSIVGNYDKFNLKNFKLNINADNVILDIASNGWEDMEQDFFEFTGADPYEIKLLHALIWLSLTTYAWQDYDSICGAFYNGLYYFEELE